MNDFFKLIVPKNEKIIGYLFGVIETSKKEFNISEYSVSQTTLKSPG